MFITSVIQATPLQPTIDYTPQIIGVFGTLLGVFLGWFLSYYTNNKGNIKINIDNVSYSRNENKQFAYIVKLSIYNKSLKQRSISKINMQFLNKKQIVYEETPYEKENIENFIDITSQNKVSITNIKPFEFRTINLCGIIGANNYDSVSNANRIKLYYQNEKKHAHRLVIAKNFSLKSIDINEQEKHFE